jgi:hypothetical protein
MIAVDTGAYFAHEKVVDATLSRDRSRDLFIISHCEAFKD